MQSFFQDYDNGFGASEAFIAYEGDGKKPAILIAHAWAGQLQLEHDIAKKIAALGYVAICIDMYGKGVRGVPAGDNSALMMKLVNDRAGMLVRLQNALKFAQGLEIVDKEKIAIIGFCFGGMCALDLARSGTDEIKAAIAFHTLPAPNGLIAQEIKTKVLVLNGFDDPLAPPEAMIELGHELTEAGADWQLAYYGQTSHAFTNPNAKNAEHGLMFQETSARRAFALMEANLNECFE